MHTQLHYSETWTKNENTKEKQGRGWTGMIHCWEQKSQEHTNKPIYALTAKNKPFFFFFSVGPRYTTQWARGQGWRVFQPMYYFHSLHGHQQGASVTLLVTLNKGAQFTPCKGSEKVKCRVQTSAHRWVNTPWRVLTAQPFFFFSNKAHVRRVRNKQCNNKLNGKPHKFFSLL